MNKEMTTTTKRPSREEVLKIAKEHGLFGGFRPLPCNESQVIWFAAAMYEAGAASERAVSDKLLGALKYAAQIIGHPDDAGSQFIRAAISEVEAMRKEK